MKLILILHRYLLVSLRLLLCCTALVFGEITLSAQELDWGLGIGFFHGTMHSPDPIPDEYGGEKFFRDFGTPMPELGIPLSQKLKLSLRAYYHHREYQYYDSSYTSDRMMQHMGQYIDIPLSLNTRIQNWDLFGGANLGILLYDFVFDDITDDPDLYKDASSFVPGVHAGIRIPWPESDHLSVMAFYTKDLLPFSEVSGRRMYQDRYVVQLLYRFLNEKQTEPLTTATSMEELISGFPPGLRLGVGFGVSKASLDAKPNYTLVEDMEYRTTHYYSSLNLGWQVLPQLEVATQPHRHWREYKVYEQPYGQMEFTARAQYQEFPLLLTSTLADLEVSIGPNLSFLHKEKYRANYGHIPDSDQKDAADFLPGLCVGVSHALGASGRTAINLFYTKDVRPFSRSYGFDKTQENLRLYLSHDLLDCGGSKDLYPADALGTDGMTMTYELGYTKAQIAVVDCHMPFIRYGMVKRGSSGLGQGYLMGLGFTKVQDDAVSLYINRLTAQKRLSFGISRLELYAAPGLGLDTGFVIRKSHGIMDEGPRILGFGNPMFVWEAGLKLHLYKELSLVGFGAKQNTALFKTPLQLGFSLNMEYK